MGYLKVNNMEERLYLISLYDLYGNLLTEKQQLYFEEYYFNNLSLSELSELYEISRSAISKALNDAASKLNNYEDKLKLYVKTQKIIKLISDKKTKEKIEDIIKG